MLYKRLEEENQCIVLSLPSPNCCHGALQSESDSKIVLVKTHHLCFKFWAITYENWHTYLYLVLC